MSLHSEWNLAVTSEPPKSVTIKVSEPAGSITFTSDLIA